MLSLLLFDRKEDEKKTIVGCIRETVALLSDERLELHTCGNHKQLEQSLDVHDLMDLSCIDAGDDTGIRDAKTVRERFPETQMMLIVDRKQSPVSYIKPGIMASALAIRPVKKDTLEETLREFVSAFLECRRVPSEELFVIKEKEGVTSVPYSSICFFEARAKKVYVRLNHEEYGFYSTLEELEKQLPEGFLRCHRGFIVNMRRVKRFLAGENILSLDNGLEAPMSRSYRKIIKDWMHAGNRG